MSESGQSDENNSIVLGASTPEVSQEVTVSRWRRFVRFFLQSRPKFWKTAGLLGGIVIPGLCFLAAMRSGSMLVVSKWQSGQPNQYANLMLQTPSILPFYPILLFCMVCCGLVLLGGQRWINRIWVRFGIYTGVPIAIQFHLIVFAPGKWELMYFVFSGFSLVAGVAVTLLVLAIAMSISTLLGKLRRAIGWPAFVVVLLGIVLLRCAIVFMRDPGRPLAVFIPYELAVFSILGLVLGTTFAATAYMLLSWHVWRSAEDRRLRFGILQMLGGLTWSAGYLAAWRASVVMVLAEYETLPIADPRCYVCTAAARGHKRFVGSFEVVSADATRMVVNEQLQLLKAAELLVMVTFPKTHRRFRWLYDRIGPKMASCLTSRPIADVAFVSLKLIEWPARWLLLITGIPKQQIRALYHDRSMSQR